MRTPDRLLRADAEDLERDPPELTPREQEQYTRILTLSEGIMARRGTHTMTLTGLAHALSMGAATLRRHFSDLDALLATLLCRHLRKLACAINKIPHDAADRPQKMRAAYLAYTRTDLGGYTDAHLLLVRDCNLLPEDLFTNIEGTRRDLGDILAYGHSEAALNLLDTRTLDAACIEAALAGIAATVAQRPKPVPLAPKQAAPCARPLPTRPPWAPNTRDPLGLLRFGPVPTLPNLTRVSGPPQVHSSA
jgi:AcrR family transcriptional regulator